MLKKLIGLGVVAAFVTMSSAAYAGECVDDTECLDDELCVDGFCEPVDGGDGGDVYIVASSRLGSLLDLRFHAHWKGNRGVHGQGSGCHGKRGEDSEIQVPPGTVVKDWETGELQADLATDGARYLAARGGRGGKGNAHAGGSFARRSPLNCQRASGGKKFR